MSEKEQLIKALFPTGGGEKLLNLKFLPLDPEISEAELCQEFLNAREEHRSEQSFKMPKIGPYLKDR